MVVNRRRPPSRRTAARTRPGAYPAKRGSRSGGRRRQPRTFGEQVSAVATREIRQAVRLGARATMLAVLVVAFLAVSCVARVTGHVPESGPARFVQGVTGSTR